jgi:hypothetical protein
VNDTLVTWTNVVSELGADFLDSTKTDFTINGGNKDTSDAISLSVQGTGNNLPTGMHQSDNSNFFVLADHYTVYNSSSNYYDYDIDDAAGMATSIFTITLTSISAKKNQGNVYRKLFDRYIFPKYSFYNKRRIFCAKNSAVSKVVSDLILFFAKSTN